VVYHLAALVQRVVSSKLIVSGRSKCRRIRSSKKAADSNLEASLLSARPRNVLDGKRPHGRVLAEPARGGSGGSCPTWLAMDAGGCSEAGVAWQELYL